MWFINNKLLCKDTKIKDNKTNDSPKLKQKKTRKGSKNSLCCKKNKRTEEAKINEYLREKETVNILPQWLLYK